MMLRVATLVIIGSLAGCAGPQQTDESRIAAIDATDSDALAKQRMLDRIIWQGETADQLRLSMGEPKHIDRQRTPGSVEEIWHYGQLAPWARPPGNVYVGGTAGQSVPYYTHRVYLTNGVVTSWVFDG